jgi:hypothetical protein
MRAFGTRSPEVTLAIIFSSIAAVGIALSLLHFVPVVIGIASVLVAAGGIVTTPWLAVRSGRGSVACSTIAVVAEIIAALLLLSSPPSNSDLWVPINLGRFGGVIVAELGLALSVHAAVLGRVRWGYGLALVLANVVAVAIGVAIADWETRT